MYDLKEVTFLTFVRLDNEERIKNLRAMHDFYRKHCQNYTHIIVEEDKTPKVLAHLDLHKDDIYVFTESDTEWNKCEGYNKGIKLAKTNILVFNDVDVIIHPDQIERSAKILRDDPGMGMIYPYNGMFLCVSKEIKEKFSNNLDYLELEKYYPPSDEVNWSDGNVLVGHNNSKGGCVMGRRDSVIRCNGYNPHFLGWGYEDDEMPGRVHKLGFSVTRISGEKQPCWHLPHDGPGQSKKETQEFYEHNRAIVTEVENSTKEQLQEYIKTWRL